MNKLILTTLSLISATLLFAQTEHSPCKAKTGIIAHRGYWKTEGSAQNSIASLTKAQQLGIYGSEFDVNRRMIRSANPGSFFPARMAQSTCGVEHRPYLE